MDSEMYERVKELQKNGLNIAQVARELGIHPNLIYNWRSTHGLSKGMRPGRPKAARKKPHSHQVISVEEVQPPTESNAAYAFIVPLKNFKAFLETIQ